MSPLPCVQPAALPRAAGISSPFPVVLLATGLNGPDDLLYVASDGSVLVGEHGNGHIDRITAPGKVTRLPQVVPEVEGIAEWGGVTYVADQLHNRVVALTTTGVRTLIQLQPVPSGENLDGIGASEGLIVIPDSPHGTVLFVDPTGKVVRRETGFSRPVGVWVKTARDDHPWLVADENAGAVYAFRKTAGYYLKTRNLAGVDDVVSTNVGYVIVTLPGSGRVVNTSTNRTLASGLHNPQGLELTGAQNLLVTESDSGRVVMIVRTIAVSVPAGTVQLQPGQPVCIGILRAPGYDAALTFKEVAGGNPVSDPGTGSTGMIVPDACPTGTCTLSFAVGGPDGGELAHVTYRD